MNLSMTAKKTTQDKQGAQKKIDPGKRVNSVYY